jgi:hypothetical protein
MTHLVVRFGGKQILVVRYIMQAVMSLMNLMQIKKSKNCELRTRKFELRTPLTMFSLAPCQRALPVSYLRFLIHYHEILPYNCAAENAVNHDFLEIQGDHCVFSRIRSPDVPGEIMTLGSQNFQRLSRSANPALLKHLI